MHARIQIYWCRSSIFRHLKLELLTQFPASNDEKYINVVYIWRKFVSFYGYVHWRMTTEISVMYGSEKVKRNYLRCMLTYCSWTHQAVLNPMCYQVPGCCERVPPEPRYRGSRQVPRRWRGTTWDAVQEVPDSLHIVGAKVFPSVWNARWDNVFFLKNTNVCLTSLTQV